MNVKRIVLVLSLLLLPVGCESETPDSEAPQDEGATKTADETPEAPSGETEPPPLELPNASEPISGLTAAGQPSREQFDMLRENGYRAVINLRTAEEQGAWDEKREAIVQKIGYAHIPIAGPDDLTKEKVKEFDEALSQAPSDAKVLVHCGSSNRVGAMLALRAFWEQEASAEEALALGKKAGMTSLEGAVKTKIQEK